MTANFKSEPTERKTFFIVGDSKTAPLSDWKTLNNSLNGNRNKEVVQKEKHPLFAKL